MTEKFYSDLDILLEEISKSNGYFFENESKYNFENDPDGLDSFQLKMGIINYALSQNLIRQPFTNETLLQITPTGLNVLKHGGWREYLNYKDKIEKRDNKQSELNLKISEFQIKTKWLPLILSIISLIFSLIALFK
ncbi:hypothetical protein [Maribacter flavus]|uniref:Uncharacterized protein n=1 Tax=Maribacter flavus TaxID=1658664 RepID=A0A5B2TXC2_9FLAO|nr:hypothetical protein [Maribacter flavus]KAA2218465.1 hypothetical protein F0361_02250 [Maribacter flavus]